MAAKIAVKPAAKRTPSTPKADTTGACLTICGKPVPGTPEELLMALSKSLYRTLYRNERGTTGIAGKLRVDVQWSIDDGDKAPKLMCLLKQAADLAKVVAA